MIEPVPVCQDCLNSAQGGAEPDFLWRPTDPGETCGAVDHDDGGEFRVIRSGYASCACSTCMEIAVSSDLRKPTLCPDCKQAGCDGVRECCSYCEESAQ